MDTVTDSLTVNGFTDNKLSQMITKTQNINGKLDTQNFYKNRQLKMKQMFEKQKVIITYYEARFLK